MIFSYCNLKIDSMNENVNIPGRIIFIWWKRLTLKSRVHVFMDIVEPKYFCEILIIPLWTLKVNVHQNTNNFGHLTSLEVIEVNLEAFYYLFMNSTSNHNVVDFLRNPFPSMYELSFICRGSRKIEKKLNLFSIISSLISNGVRCRRRRRRRCRLVMIMMAMMMFVGSFRH